ncbi:HNH endonuclease [Patescibacteria group bacterium]|nr:HNH endonuclease [Patescibacteria group bacterium]
MIQTTGKLNPNWKGGSFIQDGYRFVMNKTHPKAVKGYVFEHRLVAEKIIGRPLNKNEIVHHLDGNRLNNTVENIVILSRAEHARLHLKGKKRTQELKDKVSEGLRRYWLNRKANAHYKNDRLHFERN